MHGQNSLNPNSPELHYLTGFQNHFETEIIAGALPKNQNSPQKPAHGLFSEQLSGSAFTAPRNHNLKSWLYKKKPSVAFSQFKRAAPHPTWLNPASPEHFEITPEALRSHPFAPKDHDKTFLESITTFTQNGNAQQRAGSAISMYYATQSMSTQYLCNADAEMMIVPNTGDLFITTEMGLMTCAPLQIAVIPRGIKFKVDLINPGIPARGYVLENFGAPFQLPELGPIGSNGLAHARHFETPVAFCETLGTPTTVFTRYLGELFTTAHPDSPCDTVAWHGNYAPYRYDLRKFNTINTVSYDHPDPSIFTVLTSPTPQAGTANVDFVIFPPRWMVAENTFRPPYFHRNTMSEFMGLITGQYDAKPESFRPGGASLHNCMTPHGPDTKSFESATHRNLAPEKLDHTMAFMWESAYPYVPAKQWINSEFIDRDYPKGWAF